jgi:hypothetical protein
MNVLSKAGRRLVNRLGLQSAQPPASPSTHVGETTPCGTRLAVSLPRRLNLLLPSINARHYFGGIHTAVQIYRAMATHFPAQRIVLMDSAPDEESLARFPDHQSVSCDAESMETRQIVDYSDRYGRTLPVGPNDIWLVTAWWTAYAGQRMAAWQRQQFGNAGDLAYLIQDFEPGFYPWSSQHALALGTYRPDEDLAIFNTGLLADFFFASGMAYRRRFVFEPTLNDDLRDRLEAVRRISDTPRARRIVVYARPSTPRNAFEMLCEGLRMWGWSDARCCDWEVVAAGELASDLDLGPFHMQALGKLAIQDYADLLAGSAIGVSLMISPHPSYPPLEMAAFGMGVVTNMFANKDLSKHMANVRSCSRFSPEAIAQALTAEVDAWEARGMMPASVMGEGDSFLKSGGFDSLAEGVFAALDMKIMPRN